MEAEYEVSGRSRWVPPSPKPDEDTVVVGRLPIKLLNGLIQQVEGTTRLSLPASKDKSVSKDSESEETNEAEEEEDFGSDDGAQVEKMAGQKGRFGRLGIAEIVGAPRWKNAERLEAAKEQIATLGAEILAGGELFDVVSGLRRMLRVALMQVQTDSAAYPLIDIWPTDSPFPERRSRIPSCLKFDSGSRFSLAAGGLHKSHTRLSDSPAHGTRGGREGARRGEATTRR